MSTLRKSRLLWFSLTINVVVVVYAVFLASESTQTRQVHTPLDIAAPEVQDYASVPKGHKWNDILDGYRSHLGRIGSGKSGKSRTCGICDVASELCEEYGKDRVMRAMSYMGSGDRMKRFIVKAREGKGFTVGAIGGSVSKGFGLSKSDQRGLYGPRNLHRRVFDHLNDLFPAPNGVENGTMGKDVGKNGFINGALGGTGTDYFSWCFQNHIPKESDLILTELSINDELSFSRMDDYELMVRAMLDLPERPAILNVQIFALMFPKIALGGDVHNGVSQYYDIPVVSLRNLILPDILRNNTMLRTWFFRRWKGTTDEYKDVDLRHVSPAGHKTSADLMNAYIDMQICELEQHEAVHGKMTVDDFNIPELPRLRLYQGYNLNGTTPKLEPTCRSTNSQLNPLIPDESEGWSQTIVAKKHYFASDTPGSKFSFKLYTGIGTVEVSYLRARDYGLGSVKCWMDDDILGARRIDGYWTRGYNIAQTFTVASHLEPGDHVLHCELLDVTADPGGGKEFRFISVMSI